MYIQFVDDNYPVRNYDEATKMLIMFGIGKLVEKIEYRNCVSCGKKLPMKVANIYDHDGGWDITPEIPKQWVSIECKCGYHNSINKLGVTRT